jgi:CSLREA domain-containing protein
MKRRPLLVSVLMLTILALAFGAPLQAMPASTITVTTAQDESDGSCSDGDCSLRDAIALANPGDTIDFNIPGTPPAEIKLNSELTIGKQLTVSGPGWDHVRISGQSTVRAFNVSSGVTFEISGVAIVSGKGVGGAINVASGATVTALWVVFAGNSSTANGGAINNLGDLTLRGGAFDSNSAGNNGGAVNNEGTLVVDSATFWRNSAAWGGALKNEHGVATIENCTFYLNHASVRGSALDSGSSSSLQVTNSTFYDNGPSAAFGNPSSTTTAVNTIIADNTGGNCSGAFQPASNHNMADDATCSPGFTQVATASLRLTWAGFPVSIGPGSVAVDAGTNTGCPSVDQMGHSRPQDGDHNGSAICDVGCYELPFDLPTTYLPLVVR